MTTDTGRRAFLRATAAMAATGALPALSWADAGAPAYLAAAKQPSGDYALLGLSAEGAQRFEIGLPGRGHAAAAHPNRPIAVAFARRPGVFALVIDCATGAVAARLDAPEGRHFYGHGAFDAAGRILFTCENAYETGEGVIGVWEAGQGDRFDRVGEIASHGVGPHELVIDHANGRIVVANGGIRTHPDSGRAKLNIPTMRPNLAYLSLASGELLEVVEPEEDLRLNSLRHLALSPDGMVAIAAQWQGDVMDAPPLLALHRFGDPALAFVEPDAPDWMGMNAYAGSVAFSGDGALVGVTSPRGGRIMLVDAAQARFAASVAQADVCGLAPAPDGFIATDGLGGVRHVAPDGSARLLTSGEAAYDNHLVPLSSGPA